MGAPGPFSNASPNLAEWLPLLGSIVQALRSVGGDAAPLEDAQGAQDAGEIPSNETNGQPPPGRAQDSSTESQ